MIVDPVIYAIINTVNDKHYIGQAVVKHKRWKDHKIMLRLNTHRNNHLQSAYNKYGKENIIFVVLENLLLGSKAELDAREQYWFDILKPEYNKAPKAGGSCLGFKHSEETKNKWSQQRKGRKRSGEALNNLREGQKKRGPVSDEAKLNMSLSHIGNKLSEETKAKMSLAKLGNKNNNGKKRSKPTSEETRKKISAANILAHRRRKFSANSLDNL